MFGWLRRFGDRVVYEIPPQEPAAAPVQDAVAGVDIRLSELADIPPWERTGGHWDELDRLLDRRMRLTQRPVAAGRVDSIINNYGENPW